MNYRHQFHAGNFADVMKHALLVRLIRHLQRKEKGFLFLDTHAGRGRYDLERAATGESLARDPEWPDGIGRLWGLSGDVVPRELAEYLDLMRQFDRDCGNLTDRPRFYPGSPAIAHLLARPQDRLALCEQHPGEHAALQSGSGGKRRVSVHHMDGYNSLAAMLPPPERRALALIDPPFEAEDEFARIADALANGLKRFPSGVYAIWHPLTRRARVQEFLAAIGALQPPSALHVELRVVGEESARKMKGCGLLVINPPWQFDAAARPLVAFLAEALAQEPGGGSRVVWLVKER